MADLIPLLPDDQYDAIYVSRDSDTNAITANESYTAYSNVRIRKSGDTESTLAPLEGVNAGVLAKNQSDLTLYDSYLTTEGRYSEGVYSKDADTIVKLYRTSVNTSGENSPAVKVYGGGLESYNNDIITNGQLSPALHLNGETTTIRGGNVITRGQESPLAELYSDLTILNTDNLTSEMSDGVCIFGENTTVNAQESTFNINASGFYPDEEDETDYSDKFAAVQIGSGEQHIAGTFIAHLGNINIARPEYTTAFKVKNADAIINLTNVKINNGDYNRFLVLGDNSGSESSAIITCINQVIRGIIDTDQDSTLNLYLNAASGFTGRINGEGQQGEVNVTLTSSFWSLTGDCYISRLVIDDRSSISTNGYTLWVSGQKYIPEGEVDPDEPIDYTETYTNENDNENACAFVSESAVLSTVRVIKSGDTNEPDANEYGANAAILANEADLNIANLTYITTEGKGSPGVLSYNGSYTTINETTIETLGENSSAVACSHNSNLSVYKSTCSTEGENAHVINVAPRSNNVTINQGNYIAEGLNSAVMFIDKLNLGSVNIYDAYFRSADRGIIVDGPQPSPIVINKLSMSTQNSGIVVRDENNDPTNIILNISESSFNSSGEEGTIRVDSAEVTINLSNCNLYSTDKVIEAVNGSIIYLNISGGYISGNIVADYNSMIFINLLEDGNIVGAINHNDTALKVNLVMRDGHWVVSYDSYVNELEVDKYSNIDIGDHVLYVNGVASEFIVGSVVHYMSEDGIISEEDVVIIEKTTIGEETYYTLYDTDDRITYNQITIDRIVFTGKIIDIEPILQMIDEMARDESAGEVDDGDTVVISTSDKNGYIVDNTTKELHTVHFKKTGDSKVCNDRDNSVTLVINAGDFTLEDSDIESKATYANGIVVIGEGSIAKPKNVNIKTESYNSSGTVALDKGVIEGQGLNIQTLGPNSYGARVEGDGFISLDSSTIQVSGSGSNAVIVKDSDVTLKAVTISHDRSIAPIDVSGECNIILSGGNITDGSSEIATGGLYIHNERSTDPVYPDGWDPDDHPSHDEDDPPPTPTPTPDPDIYVRRAAHHYTIDHDFENEILTNTIDSVDNPYASKDEIVVWASATALLTMDNCTINRANEESTGGKNTKYYGVGAAILCTNGSIDIDNNVIRTLAVGGNAIFAFSEDSIINVVDSNISTSYNESSGLHVADGGSIIAVDSTVITGTGETKESCPIRVDKGGGSITVNGGVYNSYGFDSPAVLNNGGIVSAVNVSMSTIASELIDIIGAGEVIFNNVTASFYKPDVDGDDCNWGIGIYQLTDYITDSNLVKVTINGGAITSRRGGFFYVTNAEAEISIDRSNFIVSGNNDFLLKCTGNRSDKGWGTIGSNGGKCTLNISNQILNGNIYWDSLSEVSVNLRDNSEVTTAIIDDESNNGGTIGANGFCDLNIDATSKLVVSGNCRLRNLVNNGDELIRDTDGRVVTIINRNNTLIVDGNSDYLINVNTYSGLIEEV